MPYVNTSNFGKNIYSNIYLYGFYSFTLPRVSAQLERLMNTNVVRLIDRKFMLELQRRIQQDYNETLKKRIASREVSKIFMNVSIFSQMLP